MERTIFTWYIWALPSSLRRRSKLVSFQKRWPWGYRDSKHIPKAVENFRVFKGWIINISVLNIGPNMCTSWEFCTIGEYQVGHDLAKSTHCQPSLFEFCVWTNITLERNTQFAHIPSMNLLHLCDSRIKESNLTSLETFALVMGTSPSSFSSCLSGSIYSGWVERS